VVGTGVLLENTQVQNAAASRPAAARLRLTATFSGCCQYCGRHFSVALTRHDSGAACPHCLRYNSLDDFIKRELSR